MGPRYVVLTAAHETRALALGRVDVGFTGLHRPLRLQAERSRSKICHSAQLSAQCSLQRLDPLLVAVRPALAEPVMTSTTSSFEKTSSSSTLFGRFSHGFKKCNNFQQPTSSCRHRSFAFDRTIQAWSRPSSIERCNCWLWSSTVRLILKLVYC